MNAEDTSRKRDDGSSSSSQESLCGRSKMKITRSNAVDVQRERDREAVKIQKASERYLCKRNRLVTSSILQLYALLERVNGALVALSETS